MYTYTAHRAVLVVITIIGSAAGIALEPSTTLDCHKRLYNYKVTQADSQGKICWDVVSVMSCWGRCDSNEISDWRFPYKKSYHPVCIHAVREPRLVLLKHCEEGVEPGTEIYRYLHAVSCKCHVCKSSEASCQGLSMDMEMNYASPCHVSTLIPAIPADLIQASRE